MNNEPPVDAGDPRWLMSAMADGEADADELNRGCAAWASTDAPTRGRWHAYHLIGDVLRSEDLASPPGRDLAFLDRLRVRLDHEPAVLAPRPLPTPHRRAAWAMPAALAAGGMALATVLVVSLGSAGGGAQAPTLAAAPAAPTVVATRDATATAVSATAVEAASAGGRVVRDAELDRYLRAHRDYATALPGSLPGGSGRSIATVSFER
jgi:sigma-E factor negative regulatory protein RseA